MILALIIVGAFVFWLALLFLYSRLTRQALTAGLFPPPGGERKPPASRATSPPRTSTTRLARRVAAYTKSSGERGDRSEVRETPRTLDALSRRIGPGSSTPATGDRGGSGQPAGSAAYDDFDWRTW